MIPLKPNQHLTIEFTPYSAERRAKHKRGITHLARMTVRDSNPTPELESEKHELKQGQLVPGKITAIYEQEIATDDTNEGIGRSLRRYGRWLVR